MQEERIGYGAHEGGQRGEDHACLLYSDPDERLANLVPFLEKGLRADERTLCVLEEEGADRVRGGLRSRGIDVEALEEEGALAFPDASDYPAPGGLEPRVAVERLGRRARSARGDGFTRLRIAADMAWGAAVDPTTLLDYENRVNETFYPETGAIGLCLYPRERFGRRLLDEVVPAHRLLAAQGDLYPNPFFGLVPSASGEGEHGLSERLEWLLPALRRASATDRARRELERVGRTRQEFLATLAHELRNPLAGLSNAAAVLEERAEREPKLVRIADVVGRQSRHLSDMLDDVLELASLGRDDTELARSDVRLDEVVRRAVRSLGGRFEEREVGLEVELPDEPLRVRVDPGRLERAVVELLSNALAYTSRGDRVSVGARLRDDEVALTVRDTGAGIAPELLPRIFQPFVRGRLPGHNGGVRLGIGLTIVKRLVERQGGSVDVHSGGRGRGAEVVVRLPLVDRSASPPPEKRGGEDEEEENVRRARRSRILVVEDDRDSALLLRDLLEAWGHDSRVVHDGARALAEVPRFRPDVIFLDLALPRMNGLEVARRIRSGDEAPDESPILVAMTGYGRPSDLERTRDAGFVDHLVKPVSIERLRRVLEGLG